MKLGTYRHSKSGKMYKVIGVANHSETLEDMVVYEALYENPLGKLWIRPKAMFLEEIDLNGQKVPRFIYTKKEELL